MASNLLPPDRSGWLDKRGGLRKNWTKRWFVLRDNELKYYKTDKITEKTSPQGTINLDGCQVEIAPEAKYSRKFCFELNSPHQNRVYVIMAENGTSLQDWMNAVRRAMLRIRREKTKAANPKNKDRTASDVDDKKNANAAAAAALATAAPPPKPTSAAGFGGAASLSTAPAAASSSNGTGNGTANGARNSASASGGGDTLGVPEPASSLVHRHSTASKSEVSRPVDAPPPVATSASRFGSGGSASKVDDNHKFDVYLQWLEEQNKDKAADPNARVPGRSGSRQHTGHHQLLDPDDGTGGGGGLCGNCKCTLM